jgi:uncharacterized delta-60 repeat protein
MKRLFFRFLAVASCLGPMPLLAASGNLDTTFGSSGSVISSYGGITQFGPAVKIQSDQKIVAVGKHYNGRDDDFLVQRFLSDGTPDTTFGTNGATVIMFSSADDNAKALDIQSDGKIIIAGGGGKPGSYERSAMVRVAANGVLDTSFGNRGMVSIDFGQPSHLHSVVLQSDGRILVTGESYTTEDGGMFTVARYMANGAPDTSFGVDGKVTQAFGTGANAHSMVLQADGKLLIGGYSRSGFLVVRFMTNGTLDTSFGTNGSSTVSVGISDNYCHTLLLQSDGKIVLSGSAITTGNNFDFVLLRFNSDGSLDTGFGTNGIVTTNFVSGPRPSKEETAAGILQPDGKIVVGGYSDQKFALARYLTSGALDTSFGTGGIVTSAIGSNDWIKSLALQSWDGKIVAAGFSQNNSTNTFNLTVARYLNDSGAISANDCLFNWAERIYPELFPSAEVSMATYAPFYYRYYPGKANYLATSSADNHIWVLGPSFLGNSLLDVGPVASFMTTAGCSQ